jgi:hypothetical protein
MRIDRRFRAVLVLLVAVALVTTPARHAAADTLSNVQQGVATAFGNFFKGIVAGILTVAIVGPVVVASTATFTIHDGIAVSNPPPASKGWSIAETVVVPPLAAGFDFLTVWATLNDLDTVNTEGSSAFFVLPAGWMNGLATHGIWALAAPQTDTEFLFGGSMVVGIDLAFTAGAIGSATRKHLGGRAFGALEMVATAPAIAVGAYELATPGRPYKPAFAGLTAWSGALFVHGIAAVATGIKAEKARIERLYPKQPGLTLTPTLLRGGPVPASAFVVCGVW